MSVCKIHFKVQRDETVDGRGSVKRPLQTEFDPGSHRGGRELTLRSSPLTFTKVYAYTLQNKKKLTAV